MALTKHIKIKRLAGKRLPTVSWFLPLSPQEFTLAIGDTWSQFPPLKENLPSPILAKITAAVSSGPCANGVYLNSAQAV